MQASRRVGDEEKEMEGVIEEEKGGEGGERDEEEEETGGGRDRRVPRFPFPGNSISSTLLVCTRFSDTQRHTHNSSY